MKVDLQISNRYCDLIESGLDLAIRTRRVEADSSVTMRKLAEVPRILTASPAYLKAHGCRNGRKIWSIMHFCSTPCPMTGII